MDILISIDDTDNLESPGSGTLAENMAMALQAKGLAECGDISRHQLLVHDAIPYTSGNSAMCFPARSLAGGLDAIIGFGQDFLQREAAAGSDPGLCVVHNDGRLDKDALIAFGQNAKKSIVSKDAAYHLAAGLGVHLSEHGGTGGGIIGALAAIGLRLHGSDGRLRGWHRLGNPGDRTTPADLCTHPGIDAVVSETGERLGDNTPIVFSDETIKTVLLEGLRVVPVTRSSRGSGGCDWVTLSRKAIKRF